MKELGELILKSFENDQDATEEILSRFRPLLNKYARKLNYEDAFFDLQLKMLELLRKPFLSSHSLTTGQIVSYLHQSIIHEYIRLSKENSTFVVLLDDLSKEQQHIVFSQNAVEESYASIDLDVMLDMLSPIERIAVYRVIIHGDSSAQVAKELGCSRQSINQAKKRGISKLQSSITE